MMVVMAARVLKLSVKRTGFIMHSCNCYSNVSSAVVHSGDGSMASLRQLQSNLELRALHTPCIVVSCDKTKSEHAWARNKQ